MVTLCSGKEWAICAGVALAMAATGGPALAADAHVRQTSRGPVLIINGKPTAPVLFQIGLMNELEAGKEQVRLAGKAGVAIVSPTIWGMPWFRPGEAPTLKGTDIARWLDAVVEGNPRALLLPRFPVDQPPVWWTAAHPNEMTRFDDGTTGLVSVHSQIWRRDAAVQIGHLIRLLEARYGDRMVGYHVCGQHSAEWFYDGFWDGKHAGFEPAAEAAFREFLRNRYRTDDALRSAWADPRAALRTAAVPTRAERIAAGAGSFRDPVLQCRAIDFDEFQNVGMADAVAEMCRAVRRAAPRRLSIAFYGYTFELSGSTRSGHLGLSRLLRSPDIDALCGPLSYPDRQPGGSGRFMGPVDSVLAAGKLWFTEDDTRTHLTPPDAGPGRCPDLEATRNVLTRNFAHALCHGAGLWWMEPVGSGVFNSPELWERMGRLAALYAASLGASPFVPEVQVVVDEMSCMDAAPFVDGGAEGTSVSLLARFRDELYRLGAPVGLALLDDVVAGRAPRARLTVILNAWRLDPDRLARLRAAVCRPGAVVIWMYAPGAIWSGRLDLDQPSAITGIGLRAAHPSADGRILVGGADAPFNAQHGRLSPMLCVDDPAARVLARYAGGGEPAIAAKRLSGLTSVFCGVLQMPRALLRDLARQAGVHLYCDADAVVTAGRGFLAVHAVTDGPLTLRLRKPERLRDAITGEDLGIRQTLPLPAMSTGASRLFQVGR